MTTKQKVSEAKDWSRDELNAWLQQEGFHMIEDPAAAEEAVKEAALDLQAEKEPEVVHEDL